MSKGFSTRAVHQAGHRDEASRAVTFPIFQTATFGQTTPGQPMEYMGRKLSYARSENPTRTALEDALASVEEAQFGLSFASGLAAVCCVMNSLKAGDRVVACSDLYGGSYRQFTQVYAKLGIEFDFVETTNLECLKAALEKPTAVAWLETPSNPLLNVTDLEAATKIAHEAGALALVDNTFATPYLQQPLKLGADIVLHSTTKYLNGHSDVINGALLTDSKELWDRLKFVQNACGLIPGPQDCYLVMRGLKTLGLRMERHCANARAVADWLSDHPKVSRVYYPGLATHPGHQVAKKQMRDFGAMLSFEVTSGWDGARRFMEEVKLFTLAESLGCVQSLVNHPASMTHASVPADVRNAVGITDGLIRLSIGIEDAPDIIADLEQALEKA
ncbi:MAG: PLP-dependent transferase [Fimbriimonadaceae bacterium]|nr:PLP-dependent transferase [Fimbriimonadaceae bacterium]QYK54771.1 MAG: PLP-dependent transferase [Fimbriimonadaceae bacterium]